MIKLGLIGCGNWGGNHLRSLMQMEDAELKWVCDADPLKLAEIKRRYPTVHCTPVFTDVLDDAEVDGVIIATPPVSHAALGKKAIMANKHVFVEKPLALASKDALKLVECAEKKERLLMVGHLLRYHPAVVKMKELIDRGELGDVFYFYSQRLNLGVIRRFENALWNLGCHDISVMLYLFGELPMSVSAMGQAYAQSNVEDIAFVNLYFPHDRVAHIHLSWLDPHKVRKMTVVGSKKMLVFDDMKTTQKLIMYNKGFIAPEEDSIDAPIEIREGSKDYPEISNTPPLSLELEHFAECIQTHNQPDTDGREGLHVVQILEAAQRSLENGGRPENLNWPKKPQKSLKQIHH